MKHLIDLDEKTLKLATKVYENEYHHWKATMSDTIRMALVEFLYLNGYKYNRETNEWEINKKEG